ncbi:ABC transporter ATP-binding protein [Microbispora sp. KK1-11]|uniref:ABC transporter ATP-binding protein n=1 Tax=Microbispora sp. KK1-11 TaxID=2053005 RepID=UPI00115973A9|nr:ABC transporter ATP-binding protein [Microbispora sp. KK1-11]
MASAASHDGLRIQEVTRRFPAPEGGIVTALDDVSLVIEPAEFFVLLGPSGCGKTTLLRTIAGLEYPDEGEVWLGSERLDVLPPYKRRVNTVFQSYALFPHLTVAENVSFGLEMEGMSRRQAAPLVAEALELVRLPEHGRRRPAQLSGGQQQRVALARALAKRPEVLLLDEPLAALDLKLRRGMQTELKRIQQTTGVTFVFVTHDQEEAISLGDRLAVFQEGTVAQIGTPQEVYERPANRFVADFIGETSFLTAERTDAGYRLKGGEVLPADRVSGAGGTGGTGGGGGEVTIALRPEHLVMGGADAPLHGVVRESVYVGSDVRVGAELAGGERVVVRLPVGAAFPEPGERVGLDVLPGRGWAVAS